MTKQKPSTKQEPGLLSQDLDDGAYHEEDEQAECFSLRVQNIIALEWGTSHSLGLGSNDYTPALVMHVIKPTSGATCCLLQLGTSVAFTWHVLLLLTSQETGKCYLFSAH